jgi:carbon dioxide concentrating mechanism protein CcmL
MLTARVEGTVVATVKDPRLKGVKLLLIRAMEEDVSGGILVAADRTWQAGVGDFVTCITAREASLIFDPPYPPCDLAITGFVDNYNLECREDDFQAAGAGKVS